MHPTEAFLAELEQEAATTRSLLEQIDEAKYSWRANDKAMSISELGAHIASIFQGMPGVLGGESFDITQRPAPEDAPTDRAAMLALFDSGLDETKNWLDGLGDSAFETWRLFRGDEPLMEMPRAAAIRSFLFNHLYHHRGQLSGYLRAAGEFVPSVYGPTADIDPFAS